jgi:hypothetical protein
VTGDLYKHIKCSVFSILTAISKVLESVVKEDLEAHIAAVNGLQFGFRKKRSCSTALASAHASWTQAAKAGKVVGIMAFDLSAAFNTISKELLIPKLAGLNITGLALRWFNSYMLGGQQCVAWNDCHSAYVAVKYGVRQGSILGPVLFTIHMRDLPAFLGVGDDSIIIYANDSNIWTVGRNVNDVQAALEQLAAKFAKFNAVNGLVLNAAKTQLLYNSAAGNSDQASVSVDKNIIMPGKTMEMLGVKFNRQLSTAPHTNAMVAATKTRASLVARLSHHLPRGAYLRTLAMGLVLGKLSHALAAVATRRLSNAKTCPGKEKDIQKALNTVAHSITGAKLQNHVPIRALIDRARIPSFNELSIRAVAMETWSAFWSDDGGDGEQNPVGSGVFGKRATLSMPEVCPVVPGVHQVEPGVHPVMPNIPPLPLSCLPRGRPQLAISSLAQGAPTPSSPTRPRHRTRRPR